MSNTKPDIDNLPLDLFGDEPAATATVIPSSTPPVSTPPVGSVPPPSTPSGPAPAAHTTAAAEAAAIIPRRLRRLYDAAGILGIAVVIGILFGGFTWRILFILLISAAGYIWLLKQQRPRYYARMERFRERIEGDVGDA